MVRANTDPVERLRHLGQQSRGDVDLTDFLARCPSLSDGRLAELIEQDGRMRMVRGRAVSLERYIEAVPDLLDRPDPLDAAIDVTLRWLSRSSRADNAAIDQLIRRYPQLAQMIEEAAALNNALWSTTGLRRRLRSPEVRSLPEDFGPPISGAESGESRYVLQKLLGSGAYGEVYLAVDRQLSDDDHPAMVAVKILTAEERSKSARNALAEEATKARRIDHPNVVRVLDRGISGRDEDYIVYEYVDGGDLGRWLRNQFGPIPIRQAVTLAAQIARGVQAAHAAGVVHCDLKPNNIMLKGAGDQIVPKVADFGIAIRSGESLPALQSDEKEQRHPVGNLAYISPEQFRMEDGSLTVPSDVYALGGILFTLLTNELPNGATVDDISQTHHPDHGRTEPPRLRPLRPEVDVDLEAICRRAMAIRPEDRYSAAGAMADDLEAWLRREPIYWTQPSMSRVARLWVRRRPAMAASLLGSVALMMIGALVAGHYAIEAREAAAQAREADQQRMIEQIRADHEAQLNAERIQFAERVRDYMFLEAESSQSTTQLLSKLWALHNLFEASALSVPLDAPSLEETRFRVVEMKVDQLLTGGQGQTLEARLWKTNLLFWMIGRDEIDRAEPLLIDLRDEWGELLHANDPLRDLLDALSASLTVRQAHRAIDTDAVLAGPVALDHPLHTDLIEAEQVLVRYEQRLSESDPGNPVHSLTLRSLRDLYSPTLLNKPDRKEKMIQREEEVFEASRGWRQRGRRPPG